MSDDHGQHHKQIQMCPNNYNSNPTHHRTNQEKDKRRMRAMLRTNDTKPLRLYRAKDGSCRNERPREGAEEGITEESAWWPDLRPSPARSPEKSEGFAELCFLPRFRLINKPVTGLPIGSKFCWGHEYLIYSIRVILI